MKRLCSVGAMAGLALGVPAMAQIFPEVEPNDSKAQANAFVINDSGGVTGNSTSSTGVGLDYFLLTNTARPLGIYRHRLVLNSPTAGHTATIRGLNQIGAVAGPWPGPVGTPGTTDTTVQTGFIPTGGSSRIVQWYGFGKGEQIYYRVTGAAATTSDYTAILETLAVTPTFVGTFQPGVIDISTFGQGHSSDTDLWVYDSGFNAIVGYGNDDESVVGGSPGTGATLQSFLRRTYAPGIYYLALTNFNLANNQGSPCDDDFRTGALLDFGDAVLNSSTTINLNITFSITDSVGSVQVAALKVGQFDINWYAFEVVPAPGTVALLGLGGLLVVRRRRG